MEFSINYSWDGEPLADGRVQLRLTPNPEGCLLEVTAPFYNDPPAPPVPPGESCPQLWDYEVVETFFLNGKTQYLEVELCPHGQYLVLQLSGMRHVIREGLPLSTSVQREDKVWRGSVVIPKSYLPPCVSAFNAFAIHGSGEGRQYQALYPAPPGQHLYPDFHRLELFRPVDFRSLVRENWTHLSQSEFGKDTA